jgi:hypothetical protein
LTSTEVRGIVVRMRTTLIIDDDMLAVAKSLADARSVTVGKALSDLARKGLASAPPLDRNPISGFPVFRVPANAKPITLEDVKRLEDEV